MIKGGTRLLALSMLLAFSMSEIFPRPSHAASSEEQPVSDNTLLLMLAPHTDREKAKADLLNNLGAITIADLHVNSEDYSIFQLQPSQGTSDGTLSQIKNRMKQHPEYVSVSKNYVHSWHQIQMPTDPDYYMQWPLANMRWSPAYNYFQNSQHQSAHITILTSGCNTVSTNNELGAYITEYNATVSPVQPEPVQPTPEAEGDADCSITSCATNNNTLIAGSACFKPSLPCYITLLRISTGAGAPSTFAELNAMVWSINNQTLRGGHGPISMSVNYNVCGAAPIQSMQVYQTLAATMIRQGDIFVIAAGDTPCVNSNPGATNTGNIVVAQATDMNNKYALTQIVGDPVAAPGSAQPAVIKGVFNNSYGGSSFSAPHWASAIAMLISVNPRVSAQKAYKILLKTGTPVVGSPWPAVIPAFDKAIEAVAR